MKIIVARKSILLTVAFIIISAGVCLGFYCGAQAVSTPSLDKTIVIDAGHGGVDAGVMGKVTGAKESDINLAVSNFLKGYFSDAGFKVVMTRKTNGGLYGTPAKGFKKRDMKKRKDIIEKCNADMVISIHQNFCPIPSRRGGTVFFDKNSEEGKKLAACVQNSLNCAPESATENAALAGDYYMLKCTSAPSIIVECGFLSNADDEKLLISSDYQKKLAYTIFKGAVAYYA